MRRFDDVLPTFEEMNDPHIYKEMHRVCASVVQVMHVFRATPLEQTLQGLREFEKRQLRWITQLLKDIPTLYYTCL